MPRQNPRMLSDGSLLYEPGTGPDTLPGYDQDPSDLNHFTPAYPPCDYRVVKEVVIPKCGRRKTGPVCTIYNIPLVPQTFCATCKHPKTNVETTSEPTT